MKEGINMSLIEQDAPDFKSYFSSLIQDCPPGELQAFLQGNALDA